MQSRESFLRALERFSNRPDKDYSLTDCSSMNAMEAEGIRDILTHDHHFQQEGFNVLIHSRRVKGRARSSARAPCKLLLLWV